MLKKRFSVLLCLYSLFCTRTCHAENSETFQLPIFFPKERPPGMDSYLCTSVSLESLLHPSNSSSPSVPSSLYIEAFTPVAEMSFVHHMLLYGCISPGRSTEKMWNCGVMLGRSHKDNLPVAGICSEGTPQRILYAWARNAPSLELPRNVAFQVGGNTEIKSIVLQYHSGDHSGGGHGQHHTSSSSSGAVGEKARKKSTSNNFQEVDDVGIILHVSRKPPSKLAGVYLLGSGGFIRPFRTVHLETACMLRENKELHPFAYRTHSHSLGKVISGYRVRGTGSNQSEWTLIGKKDPQLPQMFYPVENDQLVVRKGDILAARCTMESNRTKVTHIGTTAADEMCNFYMMYYVNEGSPLENDVCYNFGPHYENFWRKSPLGLNNFPADASQL